MLSTYAEALNLRAVGYSKSSSKCLAGSVLARSSNRGRLLVLVALVGLALFPLPEVRSVDLILNPVADTFIQSETNRINGGAIDLEVRVNSISQALSITIMKFDLSGVPRNAEIFAARLTVRAKIVEFGGISVGSFFSSNLEWQEATANWANSGFARNPDGPISSRVRIDETGKDYTFDVLSGVKEGVKARAMTEILKPVDLQETGRALFPSRESGDRALMPRLAITFSEAPTPTATTATSVPGTVIPTTRATPTTSPELGQISGGLGFSMPLLAGVLGLVAVVGFGVFFARGKRARGLAHPEKAALVSAQQPTKPGPPQVPARATVQIPPPPAVHAPTHPSVTAQPAPRPGPVTAVTSAPTIPTGTFELDDALKGGLPLRSSVALVAPSSQTTDNLLLNFVKTNCERGMWTIYCTTRERDTISQMLDNYPNFAVMICHSSSDGMYQGKPRVFRSRLAPNEITVARSEIEKLIGANPRPKAALVDIVSPLMLDKELKIVRFWLGDFLQKLKQKEFSVLAHIDASLHTKDDIAIVADVFDGQIDLVEIVEKAAKFMYIRRLADRDFEKGPIKVE